MLAKTVVTKCTPGSVRSLFSATMTLDKIPNVEIDNEGKFKYILVKVKDESAKQEKYIVRGTKEAEFHPDIYKKVEPAVKLEGFDCEVQGGGKIIHDPEQKSIKVFSKSTGFGRADHQIACTVLKEHFPDYKDISFTNED